MSDIMQAKSQQRSSKFVEGRLKLSTSCVECHRRKQKVWAHFKERGGSRKRAKEDLV
jgi:hypothetical protein